MTSECDFQSGFTFRWRGSPCRLLIFRLPATGGEKGDGDGDDILVDESVRYWTLFITGGNITSPIDLGNKVDSCLVKSDICEGGVNGGLQSKSEVKEVFDLRAKGDDNRK